ncbi:protein kinase domain-containing protein [Kocuria tytonis]|uniref:non-specific serine/threonine protein kinase n=1 Tax=Kocuria tytonis TaxID=2054280 RepID=A0A495AA22_9MICC|nr:protein kinase [Kocuria tytonis]RKQ36264.1 hypothetical protein C1C97_000830 [Kocuria tytonis]
MHEHQSEDHEDRRVPARERGEPDRSAAGGGARSARDRVSAARAHSGRRRLPPAGTPGAVGSHAADQPGPGAAEVPTPAADVPGEVAPDGRREEPGTPVGAVHARADEATIPEHAGREVDAAARHGGLELVDRLGEGDGTRTWLAREQHSREEFTVTFAVAEEAERRRVLERSFTALVDTWSEISHPHLVRVRALLGEAEHATALVADRVAGPTLADRMRAAGRIAPADVAPVLAGVARALARLHENGWVHARLTPQHVLLAPDGRVLVDGYGVPEGTAGAGVPWGQGDRPETRSGRSGTVSLDPTPGSVAANAAAADPGPRGATAYGESDGAHQSGALPRGGTPLAADPAVQSSPAVNTSAADVYALGVLGWRALTGRHPGPDSHRVPLTLMCPTAPRHLVLMLEAALADDPGARPSARELATGFDTASPRSRPARRPPERMTPEVIRADGTTVRARRMRAPLLGRSRDAVPRVPRGRGTGPGGSTVPGAEARGADTGRPARRPGRGEVPPSRATHRPRGTSMGGAVLPLSHTPWATRRRLLVAGAALALIGSVAWGYAVWGVPGEVTADPGAAARASARATPGTGAAAGEPAEPGASGAPSQHSRSAPPAGAARTTSAAPGASMQDKNREAQRAVRDLVAARAAALAAGDENAAAAVYVPESRLAARDREVIRRAAAQDAAGTGRTAFSGLSMEVVQLAEQSPAPGARLTPAEAARTRTYRAQVVTRGWHGELPAGSHVTREGAEARQSVRISVVQTSQGWRLTDVTPVGNGK